MSKPRGEKHHRAKYTDEQIALVRKNYRRWMRISNKISPKTLAHRFGMPYATVICICHDRMRTGIK